MLIYIISSYIFQKSSICIMHHHWKLYYLYTQNCLPEKKFHILTRPADLRCNVPLTFRVKLTFHLNQTETNKQNVQCQ